MNLPNCLTILRLLLIPVFIGGMLLYGKSVEEGNPHESYRWWAVGAFVTASITDFLDGYIARRFHLTTKFGALVDPLADKLLILSALVVLTIITIPGIGSLPTWFILLILARDAVVVVGAVVVWRRHQGNIKLQPHWSGKAATCFILILLCVLLLKIQVVPFLPLLYATTLFILISSVVYLRRGWNFIKLSRVENE